MFMNKTDIIKDLIVQDIRSGKYEPGSRMPTRHELMEEYSLARASIDKIIKLLCDEGWLVSARGSGTFVTNIAAGDSITIYVVLNTEVECMSSNFMERHWNFLVNDLDVRSNTIIMGCHELEKFMPAIRRDPAARVIWSRPAMSSYGYIAELDSSRYTQVLVNRTVPGFNYVANDIYGGLKTVFSWLQSNHPKSTVGIIPPVFNPIDYYLAEREAYFYELANSYRLKTIAARRVERNNQSEVIESAKGILVRNPDFLYVPDYYMTTSVSAVLHDHEGDTTLIASDWNEVPGTICLMQDWKETFRRVLEWVTLEHPPKIQEKVPAKVIFP